MSKTRKRGERFENHLIITDSEVYLNKSDEFPEKGDYRVATLNIQFNDSIWFCSVKVMERDDEDQSWYIQLPGSFRKTEKHPEGRRFDHVKVTNAQFNILRTYCYDRVKEAQEDALKATPKD